MLLLVEKADCGSLMQNTFTSINGTYSAIIFELTNVKYCWKVADGKTEVLVQKPVPMPDYPPQIPH